MSFDINAFRWFWTKTVHSYFPDALYRNRIQIKWSLNSYDQWLILKCNSLCSIILNISLEWYCLKLCILIFFLNNFLRLQVSRYFKLCWVPSWITYLLSGTSLLNCMLFSYLSMLLSDLLINTNPVHAWWHMRESVGILTAPFLVSDERHDLVRLINAHSCNNFNWNQVLIEK